MKNSSTTNTRGASAVGLSGSRADARDVINECSGQIVDAAMRVHSALGPGCLESAYETCLAYELRDRGLRVQTQVPVPTVYRDVQLELGFRADLLVNDLVMVELKAVAHVLPVHEAQLLSYLKLSGHRLGLRINFHVPRLKDSIVRMINDL